MPERDSLRGGHPCLVRGCGHPERDHWATPELAGPLETVVWCSVCRRHETRRPGRFRHLWASPAPRHRRRLGGAA